MNSTIKFKSSWESLKQYAVPEWYRDAFDWWIDQYVVAPYSQKFAAYYYNRTV